MRKRADTALSSERLTSIATSKWTHIIFLLLLCTALYANTLNAPFVFDDLPSIVNNSLIKDTDNFFHTGDRERVQFFLKHKWDISTRLVGYFSFALNYRFGGLDVRGYHATNIIIHFINSTLVYLLILLTLRTPFFESYSIGRLSTLLPLATASLFASHPVQTQAVTYIVQRLASLGFLFYTLSLVLYILWRLQAYQLSRDKKVLVLRTALYALSLISFLLGLNTKEHTATLPAMLLLFEYFFFTGNKARRALPVIPYFLSILIIPAQLIFRGLQSGGLADSLQYATRLESTLSRYSYLMTEFTVIPKYIRLLVFPVNQNLFYDYPVYDSFFAPVVLISFAGLAVFFASDLYALRQSNKNRPLLRLVSYGILWFFITNSVESGIIPIRDVIFEHRIYLPSFGFFLFLCALGAHVTCHVRSLRYRSKSLYTAFVVILIALSIATVNRNTIWQENITLWEDNIRKSPKKMHIYNNLSAAYIKAGKFEKAIAITNRALTIDPSSHGAYHNLGRALGASGRLSESIAALNKAVSLEPRNTDYHNSLGITYLRNGENDKAVREFLLSIQSNFLNYKPYGNIGIPLILLGRNSEAVKYLQTGLMLEPDLVNTRINLALAYERLGHVELARDEYKKILELDPSNAKARKRLREL